MTQQQTFYKRSGLIKFTKASQHAAVAIDTAEYRNCIFAQAERGDSSYNYRIDLTNLFEKWAERAQTFESSANEQRARPGDLHAAQLAAPAIKRFRDHPPEGVESRQAPMLASVSTINGFANFVCFSRE